MNGRRLVALLPLLGALALSSAIAQEPASADATTSVPAPAPAAGTEASAPAGTSTSALAAADEADRAEVEFKRDLRTVEQDTTNLKERVFRSKATLVLLKELILDTAGLGSKVMVYHVNKMSSAYAMESAQYFLDGKNVFSLVDANELGASRELTVYDQALPPGTHNLQVSLLLKGNGYGVFNYVKAYSFRVTSSYSFTVEDGRETTLRVIANERGGPWRTYVDRPNVEYQITDAALAERVE